MKKIFTLIPMLFLGGCSLFLDEDLSEKTFNDVYADYVQGFYPTGWYLTKTPMNPDTLKLLSSEEIQSNSIEPLNLEPHFSTFDLTSGLFLKSSCYRRLRLNDFDSSVLNMLKGFKTEMLNPSTRSEFIKCFDDHYKDYEVTTNTYKYIANDSRIQDNKEFPELKTAIQLGFNDNKLSYYEAFEIYKSLNNALLEKDSLKKNQEIQKIRDMIQ